MNYAVGLYRKANEWEQKRNRKAASNCYQKMLKSLESARATLLALPSNLFIDQALEQCEQFIGVAKSNL